jgi:hypothetical protein
VLFWGGDRVVVAKIARVRARFAPNEGLRA